MEQQSEFVCDGESYEMVTCFRYLGDVIEARGGCELAVRDRIAAAWCKYRELAGVLCAKDVPLDVKGMVYRACVRPVMLYGCECWPLRESEQRRIQMAERRMLRWMTNGRMREAEYRHCLQVDDVAMVMRMKRLQWFGHVERRDREAWVRRVQLLDPGGRRTGGRPRMTWKAIVEQDLVRWNLKKEDACDRGKWRNGLRATGMREVQPYSGNQTSEK